MMSFRFNPIAFINRRSSKTKSKQRSESVDQRSLSYNDNDEEFQSSIVVKSYRKPSKKISYEQDIKSPSSSIRTQVIASLRRNRSPKRKIQQQSIRAISVPPITPETNNVTIDVIDISNITMNNSKFDSQSSQSEQCKSPAPLAQDDCFELTDISDVEIDHQHKFHQLFNETKVTSSSTIDKDESYTPTGKYSQSINDINVQSNDELSGNDNDDVEKKSLTFNEQDSVDFNQDIDDEDSTESENINYKHYSVHDDDDDQSVKKLSVQYEIDYPVIEQIDYDNIDDNYIFSNETPKYQSCNISEIEQYNNTIEQDSESTQSIQSSMDTTFNNNIQQHSDDDKITQWDINHSDQYKDDFYQKNQESSVMIIDNNEHETIDQYKVDNTSSQDPFSFIESITSTSNSDNINTTNNNVDNYLTPPSIIITCASTESLMKISDDHSLTPPSRPPPPSSHSIPCLPAEGNTPKRPPPPSSLLSSKEISDRPQQSKSIKTSQSESGKKKRKKDKLFGLVDLGPLPTDPDPNFPFRSHFEKSVLPNPKKAIQRIIRGETKAERRQRKEQEELDRLLKGGNHHKTDSVVKFQSSSSSSYSKDWQEFQQLTARIQSTVEESISKVKTLSSIHTIDDYQQPTSELISNENWANFDQLKTTENNWADFNQSILSTEIPIDVNRVEVDENWAKFDPVNDTQLDQSNIVNWADFDQPQTSTQLVNIQLTESIDDNWADFDTLTTGNNHHCDILISDENWANFSSIETNNNLSFTHRRDILNDNDKHSHNLVDELSQQENQEETFNGVNHSEHYQDSSKDLFIIDNSKDLFKPFHPTHTDTSQDIQQLQTDHHLFVVDNLETSEYQVDCGDSTSSKYISKLSVADYTGDTTDLTQTENYFLITNKSDISTDPECCNYSVSVVDNLPDCQDKKTDSNQTDQIGQIEHIDELNYSTIDNLTDYYQEESSDHHFVVDHSGTIENLFGCDYYPLIHLDHYNFNIRNYNQQIETNSNQPYSISPSYTIENQSNRKNLPILVRDNYHSSIYNQKINFEEAYTTTNTIIDFSRMEFDKLKRSNESTDKQTTPGIDDIANSDIHVKYEQNDDFDVHMSVDSSSNTSLSNSDDIQEDVEEVEVETHRELTLHNDVINENNLDYHQNYGDDDDDVNIPTSTDVDYDADNDVPDIKDNFHSQYDQMIDSNQQEYSTEESNPFINDAFQGVIDNKLNWNEHKISIDANLKSIARPRIKPIRQETLSGNNPFRKQSDTDEPNIICPPITSTTTTAHTTDTTTDLTVDELTRAAAGIKLIYPQNKLGHHHHHHNKMKDSFDSMNSSCSFNEQDTQSSIELHNVEVLETIEGIGINPEGFDPLQTIYPDSDNENSSDSRELKGLHIKINQKANQKQTTNNSTVVSKSEENKTQITISPPPQLTKPINILDLDINDKNDEDDAVIMNKEDKKQYEDTHSEVITSPSTPPGWVDFFDDENDDNHSLKLTTIYKLEKDDIDKAFEIKCEAEYEDEDKGMVATVYPELHRPETPDPELDKPFHPLINTQDTWRLWLRYPEKKTRVKQISKYTTDRYWREVGIRLVEEHGRKVINLYEIDEKTNEIFSQPYRSVRVEPYMQLSREKLQQYDKYGKLHVFKLNHVSYKELVGIRPEKFSIKNLQNLVSHKPKQNITLDHIPIYTEILKFGSLDQTKIRQLMPIIEDALMQIPSYKDTSLNYNRQEVCCYVIDEYEGKLNFNGVIVEQKARTRIYFTAFVNGGSHIILGLNDKWRYGREVVRRCDILPIMHDEWISIHKPEFHSCIQMDEYEKDHMLQFYPLDGCRFELLRFRVSLRENHELPMHIKVIYTIDGRRIAMRCDLLVPGYFSVNQRCGAIPCEKVEIHIPFPEEWIYHLRVEKHHKYGSVHSTLRKPGKIKGLERITQMAQSLLPPSMLEASIGVAKYEHLYKAIVWRIPRIPEKSEASFRPHLLTCNLILAQHDTVPEWESLVPYCQVEYTMPSSSVSGATVRSISVEHTGNVEKFVKYLTKYKYTVDIDYQLGSRKAPVIKSLLDDNDDDDDTGNEYGRSTDQTQLNRQYDAISLDDNHLHHDDDVGDDAMKLKRLDNVEMTCDVNERQTSETAPTEFGDLLGLGTDFNVTSESISPQQTGSLNTDVIL